MKDVQATLRRLDEEIVGHKQQIARHQVEIARLQDTRMVLMHLVESDQEAAEAARREERVNLINGQHAKPVLIVRKTGSDEKPKKERDYKAEYANRTVKSRKPQKGSVSGEFRNRIMKLMDGEAEAMTSLEIGDHLGLPRNEEARKGMSNALYQLRVKGQLTRDGENRYLRAPLANGHG
jgi:hypothetical protein